MISTGAGWKRKEHCRGKKSNTHQILRSRKTARMGWPNAPTSAREQHNGRELNNEKLLLQSCSVMAESVCHCWPTWLLPVSLPSIFSPSLSLASPADILECITAPQQLLARCLSSPVLHTGWSNLATLPSGVLTLCMHTNKHTHTQTDWLDHDWFFLRIRCDRGALGTLHWYGPWC